MDAKIVCAANRDEDGRIVLGIRHWDDFMRCMGLAPKAEQGFVDQYGKFYTREDAWLLAEDQGQIIRRVGGDMVKGEGRLYSENLY